MSNNHSGIVDNIPKSVIDWLFQNVQKIYKIDPRTTFHDSLLTLSMCKENLRPRTRVFIDCKGKSRLLLCLYGKFNHIQTQEDATMASNEVPILIWIDDNYPLTHPQCFMDMENIGYEWMINVGKHIDANGQIYLPFFQNWDDKDSQYNIINTVKELQILISKEMLLRRKQPLLPPKTRGTSLPQPTTTAPPPPQQQQTRPSEPPPIPARPQLPLSTHQESSPSVSLTTPPPPRRPAQLKKPSVIPQPVVDLMDSDLLTTSGTGDSMHQTHINELSQLLNQLELVEQDTVNQVRDTRLPKIDQAIGQFQDTLKYENDNLQTIKSQLQANKEVLIHQMNELAQLESEWSQKYVMAGLEDEDHPLQIAETLGLNQLYDLMSQDMTLDDTIAILSELLNKNRITLDIFIRKTRDLAKQQFMVRLHIEKIYNMLNQ